MPEQPQKPHSALEVFLVFLRLGCTSFGGPAAHLGYFQAEFVTRRKWLSSERFAQILALSQSLPGPGSSQTGFAIGILRAGIPGGIAAFLGFTLPSALLMYAFASGHALFRGPTGQAILHMLQLVAVAVVAQAVLAMQRALAPDAPRIAFAIAAMLIVLFAPPAWSTPLAIALGAAAGVLLLRNRAHTPAQSTEPHTPHRAAAVAAALFALLFLAACFVQTAQPTRTALLAALFRAGSLVFGGGHVVLPLLDHAIVARGWIPAETFFSGYGAAQALPGPLFTFATFLGAAMPALAHPALNALLATLALFAPGLLLMLACLPFAQTLDRTPTLAAALRGVNAAVVGVLAAALIRPIGSTALKSPLDIVLALAGFGALTFLRCPPWLLVIAAVVIGIARAHL